LAPGRAVLHFATHAELHDDDPLGSSLLLTDGPLTAREILDLRLHARLVVLSACDTGLGRITGEGVLGLSRSFLEAGAGSVVVSLSKVSDLVASYQMGRFYAELGAGRPPAAALRRAQLDTLSALRNRTLETASGRPLGESPTLWAPFIVIGGSPRS
jgi:CHAT domain-containing protein